jgi:hypothetical protein
VAHDTENKQAEMNQDIGYRFVRLWCYVAAMRVLKNFEVVPVPIDDVTLARLKRAYVTVIRVAIHRGFLDPDYMNEEA